MEEKVQGGVKLLQGWPEHHSHEHVLQLQGACVRGRGGQVRPWGQPQTSCDTGQ